MIQLPQNHVKAVGSVQYIGKIDLKIYRVVMNDICSDEVILSDTQLKHIQAHHPRDYEEYSHYLPAMIAEPDYILEANLPRTALVLKEFHEGRNVFKLILRLQASDDPQVFKNSIITFMKIDLPEWRRLLRNKKILYNRFEND